MKDPSPKEKYKKIREIGRGAYGKIYQIEDLADNKIYAVKKMDIDVS